MCVVSRGTLEKLLKRTEGTQERYCGLLSYSRHPRNIIGRIAAKRLVCGHELRPHAEFLLNAFGGEHREIPNTASWGEDNRMIIHKLQHVGVAGNDLDLGFGPCRARLPDNRRNHVIRFKSLGAEHRYAKRFEKLSASLKLRDELGRCCRTRGFIGSVLFVAEGLARKINRRDNVRGLPISPHFQEYRNKPVERPRRFSLCCREFRQRVVRAVDQRRDVQKEHPLFLW